MRISLAGVWSTVLLLGALGCGADMGLSAETGEEPPGNYDGAAGREDACGVLIIVSTLTPTPGSIVVAEAASGGGGGPYEFAWTVTYATGAAVAVTPRDAGATQVDIPIDEAGSYLIEVTQTTGEMAGCGGQESLLAKNPGGVQDQMVLRLVPPPASGLPVQEVLVPITGGTPQGDLNITVEEGIPLSLSLSDAVGESVDAFVRLVANAKGFETELFAEADEVVQLLLLTDNYDVLVIPDEATVPRFAPTLALNQPLHTLTSTSRIPLDPGVLVTGNLSVPGQDPAAGSRVVLSRGRLPSTVGVVESGGGFSVRVQPGDGFGLSVAPPKETGLPDLELPDGLDIADGADLAIAYDAASLPQTDFEAEIFSHDLAQVVAGARVTLRGRLDHAGTVTVGGTALPAPGVVRRVGTTGIDGRVFISKLPHGDYDLVVEPLGHGLSDDATTRQVVTLPAGPVTLPLFQKVMLSGTLQRPADLSHRNIAGTRVQAFLRVGGAAPASLGTAPVTAADDGGAFGVQVDPADPTAPVEYLIVADPPLESGLARAIRTVEVGGLSDVNVSPLLLPRGLYLGGVVRPSYGAPLPGIYIEAYRYRPPGQEDAAARAEAVTDSQGRFSLLFCDPDDMP